MRVYLYLAATMGATVSQGLWRAPTIKSQDHELEDLIPAIQRGMGYLRRSLT